MKYVLSLSGGMASAVAAERLIEKYGREAVLLWYADTLWEDEDLHRFVADLMARWGGELVTHTDGRTPLEVAEQRKLIPNSWVAPCSFELKIKPFRSYLTTLEGNLTVAIGYSWHEDNRRKRTESEYEALGYPCTFPLLWEPIETRPLDQIVRSWGIEPPRLYGLGFPHNNCGGRCIRQGKKEWLRLRAEFPERFAEVRDWEQEQRAKGGPRGGRSILKETKGKVSMPLPLLDLERRQEQVEAEAPTFDDQGSCFCESA